MKRTLTYTIRSTHDTASCMILFCRSSSDETAIKRFVEIFPDAEKKYIKIENYWNFENPEALEIFTKKSMEDFDKSYSPSGIYQELFGRLQKDWSAFPHYSFEHGEVYREKQNQDLISSRPVCTSDEPAPNRQSRGWAYLPTWNTGYAHPQAIKSSLDNSEDKRYDCPNCGKSWIYEKDDKFKNIRKETAGFDMQLTATNLEIANLIKDIELK